MNAYIVTTTFIFAMGAGLTLATKPNVPRKEATAGTLIVVFIVQISLAFWGFSNLTGN